ncbi:MAG: 2,3-cyclic-nucleotide 2-phosphodiesterase / 3-nucleotidase [Thermotogota bacterium]|nr:2,3-cyclic-nucleotide 2-phosphodiesterase / 3-nucleotidase [Thermotogota bacterium]MDK2864230.1 2,3-cyclic-nucleotide 2-phosphodiesterase / 3-nucleotidase [Thermotogota bacterium]HCZ07203.1 bifunctional metallophosphatase/5'-nucleotidase [Thermotogota bacterium]
MKKVLSVLLLLVLAALLVAQTLTLTILHTSDLHGNIFPINYATNKPSDVGLAKIYTLVKAVRSENPNVLLIDTGDLIQGTPLEYYHARIENDSPDPMVLVMNHMGFKASVLGNHEFNYGMNILKKAISEAEFPFLSANIVKKGTDQPYFKPYVVLEVSGVKVGLLGLTTKFIPNWEDPKNIAELDFLDPVEVAKKYVKILREEEKVDVVIVGYHGGLERDPESGEPTEELTGENQGYQLLQEVPGIDALLTGHQHRSLAVMIKGVPVTQPSNWGQELGRIDLVLDNSSGSWKIVDKKVTLLSTKGVEADQEILSLAQSYEDKVQKWLDQPIGWAEGDFYVEDPLSARLEDHPLIEFINRVQMYYSKAKISSAALFNNDIKGWKEGPITLRDINAVYIYPNTLKVLKVTGKDIKDALELSASYFDYDGNEITVNKSWVEPKPRHYNYDMWEGIHYIIDVSKPVGQRIVDLTFEGKPVEMDKEYEIVLNNYRAGGGGGYTMFKGKPVVREVMMEVAELMADYVMQHKTIRPTVNHNWYVGIETYHVVEPGDTLSFIARSYDVSVKDILRWNPWIENPDLIYPGQKILIYEPYLRTILSF